MSTQPSPFVQAMQEALHAVQAATTPEDRREAEQRMSELIKRQGRRERDPVDWKLAQARDTE